MISRPAIKYQEAIDRAQKAGGSRLVAVDNMDDTYVVRSSARPGIYYFVDTRDRDDWFCTCRAGLVPQLMCLHRAAVYLYRLGLQTASYSIVEKGLIHA